MANIYTEQRLIDSNKRCLIKLTGMIDGNNAANLVVIDVSTLAYALNANGYIMTSNTNPRSSYNVSVKSITGDINMSGTLRLSWASDNNNSDIAIFGPSVQSIDFNDNHQGGIINNPFTSANTTGDIIMNTTGATQNNSFTLFIDIRKHASGYDQGQTADPDAFNWRANRGKIA